MLTAKMKRPIATCRMEVLRSDGRKEVHYAWGHPRFWEWRRFWKIHRHIRFMKKEYELERSQA